MNSPSSASAPGTNHAAIVALRWSARVLSLLALGIVALFFFGEGVSFWRFAARDVVLFLCFPLGVCAGLAIAWKWEGIGGGLAVASLAAFYLVHRLWSHGFPRGYAFLVLTLPGFLFLLCRMWALLRARSQLSQRLG